jgi:hypothetical protein
MHFEGKPMTGHMVIEKAESFYNEVKITDKCAVSEGGLQKFEEPAAKGDIPVVYYYN